ncbi:MAG: GNAT family N-acetyltransferase [candidate division Zixibacteria bacterium]|nr:GNAT family N-acetyltransferase [candidate division Zixibacteria bacterium]
MIDIRPLTHIEPVDIQRLVSGYTSDARYQVDKTETDGHFSLSVTRVPLTRPYKKCYLPPDAETLERYVRLPALGFSFGAHENDRCVGIALAEPHRWNKSLWVWELHVEETYRGRGIGRRLVEALTEKARLEGLRTLVCETQNTNAPAMDFYRKTGFEIEGIDLSYYTNDDYPNGEIAVFMKKRLV